MSLTIKCVDLFCGCGGMSLGFEASGFNIVAGIDNWKAAIRVYEKNFDHPIIEKDLMDVEGAAELIAGYTPGLIIGGPPCQDFSTAGFQDESRGRAILSICYSQIVSLVRPKYFVMENVATIRNTKSFQSAIANFRAAGYGLTQMVLDAAYCGVPQTRKRMFVVGALGASDGFLDEELMCRVLEFGPQIKDTFGSIKGGNAYKYGLYYSTQGAWMTGSHQKPRQLTEEEAIEVGAKLRDHLVAGANAIKEYGSLATIDDYKKLHQILREVTEGDIERVWFLKYYQMLYPELFATNYSDYAQRTVLGAIGEEKEKYPFVRMGQIRFYANKCGITNVMFNKIFWDYYSEETTSAKAESSQDICYSTGYQSDYPRNRILFGAPGTGKSFTLNHEKNLLLADGGEYERVTFHPDYSYANFVGTYKPVPCKDSDGKDAITYSYVPGPFMRTYVKALQNSRTDAPKPFLLVIEEINRANVAAVFGDVFQLLDRGDDEVSEYPIQASEDIKKYLAEELGGNPDDYAEIRIPDNMFIWATMNSADQGVFPMDTAFKRRWDFTYLGIDDSEAGIVGKKVVLGQGDYRRVVEWNALRKAINNELLTYKVNEDKLMGPYFISKKNLPEGEMIDPAVFTRIFKNKVIMYLFDDAAKQKRITLFGGCDEKAKNQYSKICREFDTKGVYIFCEGISSQFIDNVPEDDGE